MTGDRRLSVKVNAAVYSSLIPMLDNRLREPIWESRKISEVVSLKTWSEYQNVIYVIVDKDNLAVYVGSTNRTISERLSEHIRLAKRSAWERVFVLPMKDGLDEESLRKYEGLVGRRLRPYSNGKLPS
jgi:hypothetical protein